MSGKWDYEWLADERRGRVYDDTGLIGEFDKEEDAQKAVFAYNAILLIKYPLEKRAPKA